MIEKMIKTTSNILVALGPDMLSWAMIIGFILLLMVIFKCFTSPMKLARKKLQSVSETTEKLIPDSRKKKELESVNLNQSNYKTMSKTTVSAERLVLAYYYDNNEDMKAKNVLTLLQRIYHSLEASRSDRVKNDPKAMLLLLKNIKKQSDEALVLLKEY